MRSHKLHSVLLSARLLLLSPVETLRAEQPAFDKVISSFSSVDEREADKNPFERHPFDASFYERQRCRVYPVTRVVLAEIRGKDDRLYAVDRYEINPFLPHRE